MATLSDIIYNKREETITINYNAAVEQVRALIEKDPFLTTFIITSGCISEQMTNEIAKRFNIGSVKATVIQNGTIQSSWSIKIVCPAYSSYPYLND